MPPGVDESETFARAIRLTTSFYAWERRGRGWDVAPYAVQLEPPFRPFLFDPNPVVPIIDDARKPTRLGAWLGRFVGGGRPEMLADRDEVTEPKAVAASDHEVAEIQIALPPDVKIAPDLAEHFLLSLSACVGPVSFEVVGMSESITIQMACALGDAGHVAEQIRAYFPDAVISEEPTFLVDAWTQGTGPAALVDFGLSQEFMRPFKTFARFDTDPLIGVLGSIGDLADGEVAIVQVLFQATRAPWAASIVRSVSDWQGEAFFLDAPELLPQSKEKTNRPLLAAVIRTAVRSPVPERPWQLAKRIGGSFAQLGTPSGNELVALSNEEYPDDTHMRDVLERKSHRTGMLLNSEELVSLVHPPSTVVRAARLTREHRRTKALPKTLLGHELCLGTNTHIGVTQRVTIGAEQRLRHTHLVGASGTGKSTLLLNMLVQDMEHGHGVALIDPHGDLIDQVLAHVPDNRIDDVILVDPADTAFPIAFNILSANSELEKTLLASDLVAVFRRLSTSWGDQMTSVLSNAILAFLESPRGGTLADLRRFLVEPEFRKEFLATVQDREVVYYWQKEFPLLAGRPQAPLLTRLDTFLRPRLVRGMVTQPKSLDFSAIMNEGRILLVKLAQGAIGEENAALLGSLFVAKIHQLALGRQSIVERDRRPFFVYLDEFQHFVTPSMATLLTGARKYRIGLVLAHQELRQLWNQDRDVAGAVLANAATRICFRVGDDDAKKLEDGFATFGARDIQNLGVGQAICRVDRADSDFSLDASQPLVLVADDVARRMLVVQTSRRRYASRPLTVASDAVLPADASDVEHRPPRPKREGSRRAPVGPLPPRENHVVPELPVALPGRGGSQHKYLQELIRRWGEANGWRATVEQAILDGLGSVDVALERDGCRVACEVSVASTAAYEIGNIRKCLTAGFSHVLAIVVERRELERRKSIVAEKFAEAERGRICVLLPDELFTFLGQLVTNEPAESPARRKSIRGYNVKVSHKPVDSQGERSRTIGQTMVTALRRLRNR